MEQRNYDQVEEAKIEDDKKRAEENAKIADNMRDFWKHQESFAE